MNRLFGFPTTASAAGAAARERGSAYILALLVLVVLSLLGLSLAVTTSTEMKIGANEELLEQSFFAGDAGLSIAAAARLVRAHTRQETFRLNTDQFVDETPITQVEADIDSACVLALAPCDLCEVGISNRTNSANFKRELMLIVNTGRIVGTRANIDDPTPIVSQRLVTALLDAQPVQSPGLEALALSSPERCTGQGGQTTSGIGDSSDPGQRGCGEQEGTTDPCPL